MEQQELQKWMSPTMAAHVLGVSPFWVIKLADAGKLIGVRTALGRLIDPESVERLAREREAKKNRKEVSES